MKALFFTVSFFWVVLNVPQALSIPVEDGAPANGKPKGSTVICDEHEYKPKNKNYCCNKCIAGYRVQQDCVEHGRTNCTPCAEESFMDSPNPNPFCHACNMCLPEMFQIELYPCRKDQDVQCGCLPRQYKKFNEEGTTYKCMNCSTCQNGTVSHPCSESMDTFCRCNRKFFFDKSKSMCRHCEECDSPVCEEECPATGSSTKHQEGQEVVWIVVIVAAAVVFVAVAGFTVQYCRNKAQTPSSPDITGNIKNMAPLMNDNNNKERWHLLPGITACETDNHFVLANALEQKQKATLPMPDITERIPRHHSPKVLYAIIECVPVRQWREFVRLLGLSDHVIDTSEEDYRHYKDSQHRMLHAWTNLEGSSMDQLYQVLRQMNLGGCIERIEERL